MSPKRVDKKEKRMQIAHAAIEVFGTKGFERTRIDDVAAAAGIGKGTIYEYFENKEELMHGAFSMLMAGMTESLIPGQTEGQSAVKLIEKITMDTIHAMEHLGHGYRFFLEYLLHTSRVECGYDEMAEMLNAYRQWFAGVIEQGMREGELRPDLDAFETAAAFVAWFDGVVFHWYVLPESVSLETMGKRFLEITLRGMMSPEAARKEGGES